MSAAYNIQVHFKQDVFMQSNNINPNKTASSLIWVHIVLNIGYLSLGQMRKHDWWAKGENWWKV